MNGEVLATSADATAVIVGAIVMGVVIGLIPLIYGLIKHKYGFAIGGFFACVVGHFLLGLFLSIPLCILFSFLVYNATKNKTQVIATQNAQATQQPVEQKTEPVKNTTEPVVEPENEEHTM